MGEVHDFRGKAFEPDRFGDDWLGVGQWRTAFSAIVEGAQNRLDWQHAENPLHVFRAALENDKPAPKPRPMVFVSHSHKDNAAALALAHTIVSTCPSHDVWLDLWDPTLIKVNKVSMPARRRALLIALAVEMGLLNSTHLVALYTRASAGSAWLPYEYGRVKPGSVFAVNVAALMPAGSPPRYRPQYLHLGEEFTTDAQVTAWL